MTDDQVEKLTVEEAIRLKHDLNQQITYGPGLDARQVRDMETLTPDQQAELNRQIAAIPRSWWAIPNYIWAVAAVVSFASLLYFRQWISQAGALLVLIYSVGHLSYRSGLLSGFAEGYGSGQVAGIRKAFGITPQESEDIRDRAIEMEIDEKTIRHLDAAREHQNGRT